MYVFLILVFILVSVSANPSGNSSIFANFMARNFQSVDWCKLNCGADRENIACTHKGDCLNPVGNCKFLKVDKQAVVNYHNEHRNSFATGADTRTGGIKVANMNKLDWDDSLEFTAHCNLKNCPAEMEHDKCRITEKFKFAGQNLAWSSRSKKSVDCIGGCSKMVKNWYEEVKDLTNAELKAMGAKYDSVKDGRKVGHFTQLAWATLTHVGCALYEMPDPKNADNVNCMLACNYGPGGNMIGDSMFKEGEPASKCPAGVAASKKYPGLCGADDDGSSSKSNPPILKIISPLIILICHVGLVLM